MLKVVKKKDHYLYTDSVTGQTYHLSLDEYKKLGSAKAKKFVMVEMTKKAKAQYSDTVIDFDQARAMGFCKYGIEDFAQMLGLNVSKQYKIKYVLSKLTGEALFKYPEECVKLFRRDSAKLLKVAKEYLSNNRTVAALDNILYSKILPDITLHNLALSFAYHVLPIYEAKYPNDPRPRNVLLAKEKWPKGEISDDELEKARDAAYWAVGNAARAAEWAAYYARMAVKDKKSELKWQIDEVLKVLK